MALTYVYNMKVNGTTPTAVYVGSTQILRLKVNGTDVIHKRQQQTFQIGLQTAFGFNKISGGSCGDYTDSLSLKYMRMRYYISDKGDESVASAPSWVKWQGEISGYYANDAHTGPDTSKPIFIMNRTINLTTSYQSIAPDEQYTLDSSDSLSDYNVWLKWNGYLSAGFDGADGITNGSVFYSRAGWKDKYGSFLGVYLYPTIYTQEY